MNGKKLISIVVLIVAIFSVSQFVYWKENNRALIWTNGEKVFSKPIDIVWRGEIISTMAGGSCVGLKGEFDKYDLAMACLSDTNSDELWKVEGMAVTITGKWLGITCAYKNTIFGECVPDVRIENISGQQVPN